MSSHELHPLIALVCVCPTYLQASCLLKRFSAEVLRCYTRSIVSQIHVCIVLYIISDYTWHMNPGSSAWEKETTE